MLLENYIVSNLLAKYAAFGKQIDSWKNTNHHVYSPSSLQLELGDKSFTLKEVLAKNYPVSSSLFLRINQEFELTTEVLLKLELLNLRVIGLMHNSVILLNCDIYKIDKLCFMHSLDGVLTTYTLPELFLDRDRFDLGLKILTGIHLNHSGCSWARDVYENHLYWITGAGREIREYGNSPPKIGLTAFIEVFLDLIYGSREILEPIPVNNVGVIQNGAHRVSSAVTNQILSPFLTVDYDRGINSSREFFTTSRFSRFHIKKSILDSATKTIYESRLDLQFLIIFPTSRHRKRVSKDILKNLRVLSHSNFYAYGDLQREMMNVLYSDPSSYFGSAHGKNRTLQGLRDRFLSTGKVNIYLIQPKSASQVTEFKKHLRSKYNLSPGSIHSSDSFMEGLAFSRYAFSSINRYIMRISASWPTKISEVVLEFVVESGIPLSNICVVGSSVLEVLGLRKSRDLDVLVDSTLNFNHRNLPVDIHNKYFTDLGFDIDSILHNPSMYFTINGVKYIHPKILAKFKFRRGEVKDYKDLLILGYWYLRSELCFLTHHLGKILNLLRLIKRMLKRVIQAFF